MSTIMSDAVTMTFVDFTTAHLLTPIIPPSLFPYFRLYPLPSLPPSLHLLLYPPTLPINLLLVVEPCFVIVMIIVINRNPSVRVLSGYSVELVRSMNSVRHHLPPSLPVAQMKCLKEVTNSSMYSTLSLSR